MTEASKFTCVLIGGQSLIIQCAKLLIENKHAILTILSDDPAVHDWGKQHNIKTINFNQENLKTVEQLDFDFLFSIANLKLLPVTIIQQANKLAINFHDGPLPDYAGINVPTWAIINHEHTHAISWHTMTEELDKGDILVSMPLSISDNETALSLNTKCFNAGIQGFEILINQIESNKLQATRQNLERFQYYAKCKRPTAASTILWTESAEDIQALTRSLDYGPYWNPIGMPKIYFGKTLAIVKQIEISDARSSQPAGTILTTQPGLTLSTTTFDIVINELISPEGEKLTNGKIAEHYELQAGQQLPSLSSAQIEQLNNHDELACTHEKQWIPVLSSLEPAELPFAERKSSTNASKPDNSLVYSTPTSLLSGNSNADGDRLAQVFMLYLSRLCQKEHFSIAFNDLNSESDEIIDLYFEQKQPLNILIDHEDDTAGFFIKMTDMLVSHRSMNAYCRDLPLREPSLSAHLSQQNNHHLPISIYRTSSAQTEPALSGDLVIAIPDDGRHCTWHYDSNLISSETVKRMHAQLDQLINQIEDAPKKKLAQLSITTESELLTISKWNNTEFDYNNSTCIHQEFEKQARKTPDAIAISFLDTDLSYQELNNRANQVAHLLLKKNIKPDNLVGILVDRSIEMIVSMFGVLKAGAAYLPLDPGYPEERIEYMLHDAEAAALITQNNFSDKFTDLPTVILIDDDLEKIKLQSTENPDSAVSSDNLAYTIYTSGSTGKPKGVMVEHRNAINFFSGMDKKIDFKDPGVWLAVTSISFDISVMEIFWTLTRGFQVVLHSDEQQIASRKTTSKYPDQHIDFSLFYWNVAEDVSEYDDDIYRLLIESAKYGDQNNFSAVWTPERHFHAFGGSYPNPSVTSAALATITSNIQIRAGSCVVPLHHPIRVAEEWSMVDNFSNGRTGIAIASGWQPNDFVIMPQNYAEAKNIMFESIEQVKKLWRGEAVEFTDAKGKSIKVTTLPRPIQKELPVWVTTAGNPETFRMAGEAGANILTHLLGQTVEDVEKNLNIYREAYQAAGHSGEGKVTLLLHTLVGTDANRVKEIARGPMKNYLKSAAFLVKAAAWHFPTFKELSEEDGRNLDDYFNNISDEDMDRLLDFAFERYYGTSGLFGTPEHCLGMVDKLKEIGVTEIGCLIDYGIDTDTVLKHLPHLNELRILGARQTSLEATPQPISHTIPDLIKHYKVTHLQCTPSMADMLVSDKDTNDCLKPLKYMLVGGEALPAPLAKTLCNLVHGKVINMYGPTETTIWSTTHTLDKNDDTVAIGSPIVNTKIYILDKYNQPVPIGVSGELVIAGDGVVRGYHKQAALTSEKFLTNPNSQLSERMYRTGDLAKYNDRGILEYLGRLDQQVKIRGYRIELGEIDEVLLKNNEIHQAVVILREDTSGDKRLVAYIKPEEHTIFTVAKMRSYLKNFLPDFMIPQHFVEMKTFPLTPNGKIDKKALPAPLSVTTNETLPSLRPESDEEIYLAGVWSDVLHIENIGATDNFFELGGHSLLSMLVLDRVKTDTGIRLDPIELLLNPLNVIAKNINLPGELHLQTENTPVSSSREPWHKKLIRLFKKG